MLYKNVYIVMWLYDNIYKFSSLIACFGYVCPYVIHKEW